MDRSKITGAWLTTNRTCNNRCSFCYAQNATGKDMSFENAKKCVDNICEMGIQRIVLIGGEPTIYKDIFELISYIRSKNIAVSLATNGRKFSDVEFAKKMVELGISGINISIKGFDEEEYVRNTGCNGFFEMIKGYHNLKSLYFNPIVSYVITSDDQKTINQLVDVLSQNSIDNILFQFVKPVVSPNSSPIMGMHDMGKMVDYIYQIMSNNSIKYKIEVSFPLCLIDENTLEHLIEENKINTCCHVQAGRGIVFDTDSKILPCNHFIGYHYSDNEVGVKSVEDINDVFYSEVAETFRETARCYPSDKCSQCEKWDICGGGCFTRWLFEDPKKVIKGV